MNQSDRIYQRRIYEGEWLFVCAATGCDGFVFEYSFEDWDNLAEEFFDSRIAGHGWAHCEKCGGILYWAGYAGDRPISKSLIALVKGGHYMAATVTLAAITESLINAFSYAVLADLGLSKDDANLVANILHKPDALAICRQLTGWTIPDLSFPVRNVVAHGKGFGREEIAYMDELKKQVLTIRNWATKLYDLGQPRSFSPNEVARWLLFVDHWSQWLVAFVSQPRSMLPEAQ